MNPAIAGKGSSFKGAVAYITHDIGKSSAERVGYVQTLNMRTDDPEKAARVMAYTAEHASELKKAAGLAATGRKTVDPVYHFALTWEPSERPGPDEMKQAARSAIARLGFDGHEAVLAAHNDKDHAHIHVVLNRINPETGRTVNPKDDYKILQRWAWEYEKERGQIFCVDRALGFEKDPTARRELEQRRDLSRERGEQKTSQVRPAWEAEKGAPYPSSQAAEAVRADLREKGRALHQEGREMAKRQASETAALWRGYQDEKARLWQQQQDDYRSELKTATKAQLAPLAGIERQERADLAERHRREAGGVLDRFRDQERRQMDGLFRSQRQEFRSFLQTSHREGYVGALATAIQAAKAAEPGDQPRRFSDTVSRFLAGALHADKRAAMFLEGQKAERDTLRRQIREAQRPAIREVRDTLKARHQDERARLRDQAQHRRHETEEEIRKRLSLHGSPAHLKDRHARDRTALRERYVADKAALTARHDTERQALQKRWQQHNDARRAAWSAYKTDRAVAVSRTPAADRKAALQRGFEGVTRRADTREAPARTASAGRTPGRAPGRGTGRDRGFSPR